MKNANERLKNAMIVAHVDIDGMVKVIGVDPKTVQRWLAGRYPHPRHRWQVAELLKAREDYIWPDETTSDGIHTAQTAEIVAVYAHRADLPASAWWQLFMKAQRQIDLLGYAMLFLPEQHPNLVSLLKEKAQAGCRIRIALADPTSLEVQKRDKEEHLGGMLPALIQATSHYFSELLDKEQVAIRYHTAPMYNSIFRFDDEMYVTPHLYGTQGSKAPLLHVHRLNSHGIFAGFEAHFEAVWATTE
ncbi:MAG: hypothetical protein WCD86_20210 [Ktedonobacteraceae bacterium]